MDTTVRQAVESIGLRATSCSPIGGLGTVNEVVRVETDDGPVIVRMNLGRTPGEALTEYRMEAWAAESARQAGIRTPAVLEIGGSSERTWMVQELADGIPGPMATGHPELWEWIGRYARALQSVPLPEDLAERGRLFGRDGSGPADEIWQAQWRLNVESLGRDDPLVVHGVYDVNDMTSIRTAFQSLVSQRFEFGLYHGDLALRNLLVPTDGPPWLIDWGCAGVGITPYRDLIEILRHHSDENEPDDTGIHAFATGYGWSASELDEALAVAKPMVVLKAFDLVRWAIDRNSERKLEIVAQARRLKRLVTG